MSFVGVLVTGVLALAACGSTVAPSSDGIDLPAGAGGAQGELGGPALSGPASSDAPDTLLPGASGARSDGTVQSRSQSGAPRPQSSAASTLQAVVASHAPSSGPVEV